MTAADAVSGAAAPLPRGCAGCDAEGAHEDPYAALLGRLRAEFVPYNVLWELTHACNLHCVMCYNVARPEPELTTAECLAILEQLAEAGALRLTLSGGEILTRRDFFTLAKRARALSFALDLKTNGTLITPAIADRLAVLQPVQVDISLLGARPATFDALAGSRHTLRRVLRGVRLLRERGLRVKLNTLLMGLNLAERDEILDLARELGVYSEQVLKVSPADDGNLSDSVHQISQEQMATVLTADRTPFTPRQRGALDRTCSVGLSSCVISPYGVVYPCIELRIPAGDLRRERFGEIWRDSPILRQLRDTHTFGNLPACRICPIRSYCEGRCAGIAWKEHGDLYGAHMLACQQAQARYAQQHPGEAVPATPLLANQEVSAARPQKQAQPVYLTDF